MDRASILGMAPEAEEFFEGFEEITLPLDKSHVFCRTKGNGPPLLLLHGYPQTSAMWHEVAPRLAQDFTVICPDLRGYGRSGKPASDVQHSPYAKRAMAADILSLMDHLGYPRFLIGAHDRGGRVAHRMMADHPERIQAAAILDIAPTREMYATGDAAFAQAYWHWFWLTQAAPMPEQMIGQDPDFYWFYKCLDRSGTPYPFAKQALEEYLTAFANPAAIHASCEDYRAAHTIDIEHDNAETTTSSVPLHVLWGADGVIERCFDCLSLWRARVTDVTGCALPGGHYLAEEVPALVLDQWLPFFAKHLD